MTKEEWNNRKIYEEHDLGIDLHLDFGDFTKMLIFLGVAAENDEFRPQIIRLINRINDGNAMFSKYSEKDIEDLNKRLTLLRRVWTISNDLSSQPRPINRGNSNESS